METELTVRTPLLMARLPNKRVYPVSIGINATSSSLPNPPPPLLSSTPITSKNILSIRIVLPIGFNPANSSVAVSDPKTTTLARPALSGYDKKRP